MGNSLRQSGLSIFYHRINEMSMRINDVLSEEMIC